VVHANERLDRMSKGLQKSYVAKPVRLRPRKITMTMVIINSTEAERVTPRVNTHYIAVSP